MSVFTTIKLSLILCIVSISSAFGQATSRGSDQPATSNISTIQFRNFTTYIGEVDDKVPHGQGVLLNSRKDTLYQGQFVLGKRSGFGIYHFDSGNIYEGNWSENRMHGQGTMTYREGEKYSGEWHFSQRHGKGTYYYKDESVYDGEFVQGYPSGRGTLTQADSKYVGQWVYGQKNGKGKQERWDVAYTEVYEGDFQNGMYHGYGEWHHVKEGVDTYYVGNWVEGIKQGKGTYKINGRLMEGTWKDDHATGVGSSTNEEGTYEGEFFKGFFEGTGIFYYVNGDRYEGEWVRGKRQGKGTMYKENGNVYTGEWYMDMKHGNGTLLQKGQTIQVYYERNHRILQ